jgi:hypothetical protein
MQAPPVENPLQTIEKAQMALSRMPEDQRAQFEPALRLGGAILRKQSQGVA